MDTHDTIYLWIENNQLIGKVFFDIVSVSFAILAAGFVMGNRLSRRMVIGMSIVFSLWVIPMLINGYLLFRAGQVLQQTLTTEKLGDLAELTGLIGADMSGSMIIAAFVIIAAHALLFAGSLWFLFQCSKRPGYFSA